MSSWQQQVLAATAAIHVGGSGRPAGTGVLIEPDKVLTCRHVVAGGRAEGTIKPGITVRLPGLAPFDGVLPEQSEWLDVDAVVLTLPEPVKVVPVPLSGSLRAPPKVELVGYPQADLTEEGIWRTFTVHAATRSLVQLDWTDVGSFVGQVAARWWTPTPGSWSESSGRGQRRRAGSTGTCRCCGWLRAVCWPGCRGWSTEMTRRGTSPVGRGAVVVAVGRICSPAGRRHWSGSPTG